MKTTLIFKLKNKIRKFFGLRQLYQHPKKDITVRMDLLNHIVTDDRRDELKKLFNITDVTDNIVNGKLPQTIKEEFNSLPFSRLSDEAMLEIIRVARLDILNHINKLDKYTSSVKNTLDELSNEIENTIK
jgi:hypothetical protein